MPIVYPQGIDNFNEPSLPETTPLSESGTGTRNHVEHHADLGNAVVALEENASFKDHDHSGDGTTEHGIKLAQANTHQPSPAPTSLSTALAFGDTDKSRFSIHHTLAVRNAADLGIADGEVPSDGWKAAAFNHTHDFNGPSILNQPLRICTSTPATGIGRPQNPVVGTMIYETDTNVVRVWAKFSTTAPVWQILPVANIPTFRAETRKEQEMIRLVNNACEFTHVLDDFIYSAFGIARFMSVTTNNTAINIPEPGLYDVRATIHWAPDRTWHDQSLINILVNNVDIGRKNWEFTRGPVLPWGVNAYPGFPQTVKLAFSWRFQAGDTLRVVVQHNGPRSSFLWYNSGSVDANTKQVCNVEVEFRAP